MKDPAKEIEQLEDAIRRAHETLKDIKLARKQLDEYIELIYTRIDKEVTSQLDKIGKLTVTTIEQCETRIWKRFDNLEKLIFDATSKKGGDSLETLINQLLARSVTSAMLKRGMDLSDYINGAGPVDNG